MSLILLGLTVSGCKKEKVKGCTISSATNYNSSAEEDDGSCTYKGSLVFWWKQAVSDSCAAHGVVNIKVYTDGTFQGTLPISTQSWASAPGCGASSTVTASFNFGTSKTKSTNIHYDFLDGSGTTIATGNETRTLNVDCNNYELTW